MIDSGVSPSIAAAADQARADATDLGHVLQPWRSYSLVLLAARCMHCGGTVWAGRQERFGLPLQVPCQRGLSA